MESLVIRAMPRTILGKKTRFLRRQKKLPAVVYGHGVSSRPLELDYLAFQKIYEKAGASTLVNLTINTEQPIKVLIQNVQFHPLKNEYLHVDFHQVRMTEKITAEIPLKFQGEAPGVREKGAVLVKSFDHIKVECFPQDLVHKIDVDLSSLKEIDDSITLKDLHIPPGTTVFNRPEEIIVSLVAPRTEEEIQAEEKKGEELEAQETAVGSEGDEEAAGKEKAKEEKGR